MTAIAEQQAEVIQLRRPCTTCGGPVGATGLRVCTRHVKDELGLTYRQMDYAVRAGYLQPEPRLGGSGVPRFWPESELQVARTMARLIAAGVALPLAASVARAGEPRCEIAPGIWIEVTP